MAREHIHFVTGRLAEHALRPVVAALAEKGGFDFTLDVLPKIRDGIGVLNPTELFRLRRTREPSSSLAACDS